MLRYDPIACSTNVLGAGGGLSVNPGVGAGAYAAMGGGGTVTAATPSGSDMMGAILSFAEGLYGGDN